MEFCFAALTERGFSFFFLAERKKLYARVHNEDHSRSYATSFVQRVSLLESCIRRKHREAQEQANGESRRKDKRKTKIMVNRTERKKCICTRFVEKVAAKTYIRLETHPSYHLPFFLPIPHSPLPLTFLICPRIHTYKHIRAPCPLFYLSTPLMHFVPLIRPTVWYISYQRNFRKAEFCVVDGLEKTEPSGRTVQRNASFEPGFLLREEFLLFHLLLLLFFFLLFLLSRSFFTWGSAATWATWLRISNNLKWSRCYHRETPSCSQLRTTVSANSSRPGTPCWRNWNCWSSGPRNWPPIDYHLKKIQNWSSTDRRGAGFSCTDLVVALLREIHAARNKDTYNLLADNQAYVIGLKDKTRFFCELVKNCLLRVQYWEVHIRSSRSI